MEILSRFFFFFFSWDFTRPPLYYILGTITTALCVVLMTVVVLSWSKLAKWKRLDSTTSASALSGKWRAVVSCPCVCGIKSEPGIKSVPVNQSMIEQLVPEIRMHVLSYLDYPNLCRLSMTNSLMRKATNDDNVWKSLYHKDFWLEQDSVTPTNGWKAYYATTRAVMNVIEEFHRIIRTWDMSSMSQIWLNADYVKYIYAPRFHAGYDAVMQTWRSYTSSVDIQCREVRVRVMNDMAWGTGKYFIVEVDPNPLIIMSYVFECHNGRWYMVLLHSSY